MRLRGLRWSNEGQMLVKYFSNLVKKWSNSDHARVLPIRLRGLLRSNREREREREREGDNEREGWTDPSDAQLLGVPPTDLKLSCAAASSSAAAEELLRTRRRRFAAPNACVD